MNINANMSYREVIPRNLNPEEWIEVEINTGMLRKCRLAFVRLSTL